jgi:trk system potassium uptake protein
VVKGKKNKTGIHPAKAIVLGYLAYGLLGWLILMLPISQKIHVSVVDNFFTAITAVSTTGLITVDIGTVYSTFGQIVILLLIQAGGIGYMSFNTFVVLAITKKASLFNQKVSSIELSLPEHFNAAKFVRQVVAFTIISEIIGAISLSILFMKSGVENYIWNGVFHSISSFCTAGLSLFSNSLVDFKWNLGINIAVITLAILGVVGFLTWLDCFRRITGKKERLTTTTKIVLSITFSFIFLGGLVFFLTEIPVLEGSLYHKAITAVFQTMSATTTAGFNTLDLNVLSHSSIVLLIFLMVFGASPSGTGGGLKSTTFTVLLGLIKSTFTGQHAVRVHSEIVSVKRVQLSTATFTYYIFLLATSTFFLVAMEDQHFLAIFFEAASALGTIGLSLGITSELTEPSKVFISLLMFMGRIGILTFGLSLVSPNYKETTLLL